MRNKPRSALISAGFSPRALASSIGHAAFIFFVRDMPHASTIHTLTKIEYRHLAASKVGLNFVVGPNGPKIGECVAQ
jgi:hypothetical protein